MELKSNKINSPMVSVIVTTLNRYIYLEETLLSIQNQTYPFVEILLIDDGSNPEIAKKNKEISNKFSKCHYFYKQNTGQPDSRNYGIKKANGIYFAFCDDDDYWVLDKLEKQVKILNVNLDFDIVTGDIAYINSEGELLNRTKSHKGFNHGYIFENLLVRNRTSSVIPLLRKKVFEKTGFFNPKFKQAEDWDFWRRASYYHKFFYQNEIMAYVRIHDGNMTYKEESVIERIFLYRKLTNELIKWGKNKFSKKDYLLIRYHEKLKYKKIISNNFSTKFKQIKFLFSILLKRPLDGLHIISLFLLKK